MAEIKTRPTGVSVEDYIAARAKAQQAADCKALMAIMHKLTGQQPKMWGPSIVGYGSYRYTYASGHSGEMCLAGFAIRGRELVVYLDGDDEQEALLARLGRHKMGKSCLYIKNLADIDMQVLEALIERSLAETRRRHVDTSAG